MRLSPVLYMHDMEAEKKSPRTVFFSFQFFYRVAEKGE